MSDWTKKLFIERSDLFLKMLNQRWTKTEEVVNGMLKVLEGFGIVSGNLLDLYCGNGRISIHMAKKGFRAVGIDISRPFIEDARTKAKEYGVSSLVTFVEGDARDLKKILKTTSKPFDVVVNAWTSVGFYSIEDDLNVFKQARELSREGGILFVAETMHTEFLSIKFTPTSFAEIDEDTAMLEDRKYDPTSGHVTSSWSFYNKRGENLEYIDNVVIDHHVYSLSELCSLLRKAGWEPVAQYGSLVTLQPMNALTHMNVVARAQ